MKPVFARTLIACALAAAGPLHAEPPKFTDANLTVVPAARFVNESSGIAYLANQELIFTRRPTAQRAISEVAVRIFTLSPGRHVPQEWAKFEPCWVYFSILAPVYVNPNGTMKIGTLSKYWLQPSLGGAMNAGQYLLVFEAGGGDGHQLVRLNQADRDDYFRHGLIIEVRPERTYLREEIDALARERIADSDVIRAAAHENSAKWRCYVARPVPTAASVDVDTDALFALSDNCEAEIAVP